MAQNGRTAGISGTSRRRHALRAAFLGFALLTAGSSSAMAGGDAQAGAVIARTWCANCHVVSADQEVARSEAPSFVTLGKDEKRTAEGLEAFLFDPHPPMPDLNLTRRQIDDVIAYILSLRGK